MSSPFSSMSASKSEVRRALNLYLDGDSMQEVGDQVGYSRKSIHNWSSKGLLTDGVKWPEYRKRHNEVLEMQSKQDALEPEVDRIESFYEDNRENLRDALTQLTEDMANGEVDMKPQDAQTIYKLVQRMDNRTERFQMVVNRVLKDWFKAARKMLGKEQFNALLQKKKEIEMGVVKEHDETSVDALLSSSANLDVEYDE